MKKIITATLLNLGIFTHTFASKSDCFDTVFGEQACTYEDWLGLVWNWAMMMMIPISVLVLAAAGVLYMVSEGDSNRIGLAKKLIIGVFSGVGLLILARLLLTVIGVEGFYNV